MKKGIRYLVNLLSIIALLLIVAVQRDGTILGNSVSDSAKDEIVEETTTSKVEQELENGVIAYNSIHFPDQLYAYAGYIPVIIKVKDDIIIEVALGNHNETPSFINHVLKHNPLSQWENKTLKEAAEIPFDAVSGATLSSVAINENLHKVIAYADNAQVTSTKSHLKISSIAAILVIIFGVFLLFYKSKNRWIRIIYLILNVSVIGFWCGSFLSLALLVNWLSSGTNILISIVPFLLLVITILAPLFKRKEAYCRLFCPMGAMQELMWKICPKRFSLKIPKKIAKPLSYLNDVILAVLLLLMWAGVAFHLMDYELFSIFLFHNASPIIVILGSVFILLSAIIRRPYCTFVCPTGALLSLSQR